LKGKGTAFAKVKKGKGKKSLPLQRQNFARSKAKSGQRHLCINPGLMA